MAFAAAAAMTTSDATPDHNDTALVPKTADMRFIGLNLLAHTRDDASAPAPRDTLLVYFGGQLAANLRRNPPPRGLSGAFAASFPTGGGPEYSLTEAATIEIGSRVPTPFSCLSWDFMPYHMWGPRAVILTGMHDSAGIFRERLVGVGVRFQDPNQIIYERNPPSIGCTCSGRPAENFPNEPRQRRLQ